MEHAGAYREERMSRSRGIPYYVNLATNETVWERPAGNAVRASHLLVKHSQSRRPSSWRQVAASIVGMARAADAPRSQQLVLVAPVADPGGDDAGRRSTSPGPRTTRSRSSKVTNCLGCACAPRPSP